MNVRKLFSRYKIPIITHKALINEALAEVKYDLRSGVEINV